MLVLPPFGYMLLGLHHLTAVAMSTNCQNATPVVVLVGVCAFIASHCYYRLLSRTAISLFLCARSTVYLYFNRRLVTDDANNNNKWNTLKIPKAVLQVVLEEEGARDNDGVRCFGSLIKVCVWVGSF
ncbi:unnamed protein product [Ceratitis capitata]|uniref:(Mediterranean fruit fly) hypothetical protein n=1 Tax=Ceratitis capitata TaxID=7213 RepID=A0A811VBI3_CERCA|nr:unnamed protein product [Ceratitis capitata]